MFTFIDNVKSTAEGQVYNNTVFEINKGCTVYT